jgi:geranylgeranyl pyrophosphate synthase
VSPLEARTGRSHVLGALARALGIGGASSLDASVPAALWRRALVGPAEEFLARPGKELRGAIVRAGFRLAGGTGELDARLPLVIEILHAGSLIVDDVQDGSTDRRGAATLHEIYGVPLAINTGSWMYFWALAELVDLGKMELLAPTVDTLVRCHQGQALDLAISISEVDPADVAAVVATTTRLKTAALFRLAAELGATMADAAPEARRAIATFGERTGVALQMLDDLGSLVRANRKPKGREDLLGGRPTWPWAWLAEHRRAGWSRLVALAGAVAASTTHVDVLAAELGAEVEGIGRAEIRAHLDVALGELVQEIGASDTTDELADELARLEETFVGP